jgi:hypothetical protein
MSSNSNSILLMDNLLYNMSNSPKTSKIISILTTNEKLKAGSSKTGQSVSLSMQTDGNLVLYSSGTALWATNTSYTEINVSESTVNQSYLELQSNGNLTVYNNQNKASWTTNTAHIAPSSDTPDTLALIGSNLVLINSSSKNAYFLANANTKIGSVSRGGYIYNPPYSLTSQKVYTFYIDMSNDFVSSNLDYFSMTPQVRNWNSSGSNVFWNSKYAICLKTNYKQASFKDKSYQKKGVGGGTINTKTIDYQSPMGTCAYGNDACFDSSDSNVADNMFTSNTLALNSDIYVSNKSLGYKTLQTCGVHQEFGVHHDGKQLCKFKNDNYSNDNCNGKNNSQSFFVNAEPGSVSFNYCTCYTKDGAIVKKTGCSEQRAQTFIFPCFSIKEYTSATPSGYTFSSNLSKYLVYNSKTLPYSSLDYIQYYQNYQKDSTKGKLYSTFTGLSDFTFAVSYSINMIKVSMLDLYHLLQVVSSYPSTKGVMNPTTGMSITLSNQNTSYTMLQDYCFFNKTLCNSSVTNLCCMNFNTDNLPKILSEAAESTNVNSAFYKNYQNTTRTNYQKKPIQSGLPVPTYTQASKIYNQFCSGKNWNSTECKNYYLASYLNQASPKLDQSVIDLLQTKCATVKEGDDKDICGCFYQTKDIMQYGTDNKYPASIMKPPYQCWYPNCFYSDVQTFQAYPCPSETICTANVYNNLQAGGNISNNKFFESQTINCPSNKSSSNSPVTTNKGSVTTKKGSKYTKGSSSKSSSDSDSNSKSSSDSDSKSSSSNSQSKKISHGETALIIVISFILLFLLIHFILKVIHRR